MNVLLPFAVALVIFWAGYRFYGRFIASQIGEDAGRPTPAVTNPDGRDFVPTKAHIIFAHHFSAIAGAGPIVGPTLGLLYGFAPAWLWIVAGCVFFGAVHDYTSLFASLREGGRSIGDVAGKTLGRTGMLLFLLFTLLMIFLVTSAFLNMTAISLTSMWPLDKLGLEAGQTLLKTVNVDGQAMGVIGGIASTSVIIITMFAPVLGYLIYRRGLRTGYGYLLAATLCVISVWVGFRLPVTLPSTIWMVIISVYVFIAAGVPVWVILQPRDFTNVQILYGGMVLLTGSVVVGGLNGLKVCFPEFSLPLGAEHLGMVWPMLIITIACGAISGFHALVATGTSSKQVMSESAARRIGYGGMLLEGILAILVLLTVASSLSPGDYLAIVWPDQGSNPVLAFALAVGGIIENSFGIPISVGAIFGILLIEGFVVTTLDSAVRINRYLFEELWVLLFGRVPTLMKHFWFNSALAVVIMFLMAYFNAFKLIWPLFGSANQLLAALALVAVSVWLYRRGSKNWFTLIPAIFMIITTIASLIYLLVTIYYPQGKTILALTDLLLLTLSVGVIVLSFKALAQCWRSARST